MAQSLRFTFAAALVLYLGVLLISTEASHRQDLNKANPNITLVNGTEYFHLLFESGNDTSNLKSISVFCNPNEDLSNSADYNRTELYRIDETVYDEYPEEAGEGVKKVRVQVTKFSKTTKGGEVAHRQ